MQHNKAIVIFTKEPQLAPGNRSDPFSGVAWNDITLLFSSMLIDAVDTFTCVGGADIIVYSHGAEVIREGLVNFRGSSDIRKQQGQTFQENVYLGLESAFQEGYHRILAFLEVNPLFDAESAQRAFAQFNIEDDCLVYGPLDDGSCYMVGMKTNHSNVFQPFENGSPTDRFIWLKRLCACDGILFPMADMYAINNGHALLRLKKDLEQQLVRQTAGQSPTAYSHRTMEMFKILHKKYEINPRKQ